MYHSAQLFLAAALPTDAADTPVPGFIDVLVVGPNELPLPGASVTVVGDGSRLEAVTDVQGRVHFVELSPATYTVRAVLETFKPNTVSTVVHSEATADVRIVLQSVIVDDEDCD